jgi:hypothetical protein
METSLKSGYSRNLQLEIDLNYAEIHAGKGLFSIGIPVFKIWPYSQPQGHSDIYGPVRQWYRDKIEKFGNLFILRRTDLERYLAKAQSDAVDYLVIWNVNERKKHEGWHDHVHEAIQIDKWIFPANAVNMATLTTNWNYEKIKVVVNKDGEEIAEVHYFVKPNDHTMYFSHFGKPHK